MKRGFGHVYTSQSKVLKKYHFDIRTKHELLYLYFYWNFTNDTKALKNSVWNSAKPVRSTNNIELNCCADFNDLTNQKYKTYLIYNILAVPYKKYSPPWKFSYLIVLQFWIKVVWAWSTEKTLVSKWKQISTVTWINYKYKTRLHTFSLIGHT